jgi:hypothetical protein
LYEEAHRELNEYKAKFQKSLAFNNEDSQKTQIVVGELEAKISILLGENDRLNKIINEKFKEMHRYLDMEGKLIMINTENERLQIGSNEKVKELELLKSRLLELENRLREQTQQRSEIKKSTSV